MKTLISNSAVVMEIGASIVLALALVVVPVITVFNAL
jgi:hypothetical protein